MPLLTGTVLFLFTFFNLIFDAPPTRKENVNVLEEYIENGGIKDNVKVALRNWTCHEFPLPG